MNGGQPLIKFVKSTAGSLESKKFDTTTTLLPESSGGEQVSRTYRSIVFESLSTSSSSSSNNANLDDSNILNNKMIKTRTRNKKSTHSDGDSQQQQQQLEQQKQPENWFECKVCNVMIPVNDRVRHDASITHQFAFGAMEKNDNNNLAADRAEIALASFANLAHNRKGYDLLRAEGWSGRAGLGVREHGRIYPIKAIVKTDRAGIGSSTDTRNRINDDATSGDNRNRRRRKGDEDNRGSANERIGGKRRFKLRHSIAEAQRLDRDIGRRFRRAFNQPDLPE